MGIVEGIFPPGAASCGLNPILYVGPHDVSLVEKPPVMLLGTKTRNCGAVSGSVIIKVTFWPADNAADHASPWSAVTLATAWKKGASGFESTAVHETSLCLFDGISYREKGLPGEFGC